MVTYSDGTIRKRQRRDGTWEWEAVVTVTDGTAKRHPSHRTGVRCDPPTDAEKGRGKRVTPGGRGARQATAELRRWRDELIQRDAAARAPRKTKRTVLDFVDEYWATKTDVEDNTLKEYRKARNHIDHPALDRDITDLKPEHVQAWLDAKLDDNTGQTALKKAFIQLKAACAWGVRMGYLKTNACNPITPPRPQGREKNPLDEDAIKQLLTALDNLRAAGGSMRRCVADAAQLAMLTGMREGEVCGLRWDDIDGGVDGKIAPGGYIHVRTVVVDARGGAALKAYPKSRKYRDIPMNQSIVNLLNARRELFVAMEGEDLSGCYVIARPENAKNFMSNGYLCHRWSDFIGMTGIHGMEGMVPTFHDLRHTFATQAIAHDADIVEVSAIMGHASPTITLNIYARWTKRAKAETMRKLDGVFS